MTIWVTNANIYITAARCSNVCSPLSWLPRWRMQSWNHFLDRGPLAITLNNPGSPAAPLEQASWSPHFSSHRGKKETLWSSAGSPAVQNGLVLSPWFLTPRSSGCQAHSAGMLFWKLLRILMVTVPLALRKVLLARLSYCLRTRNFMIVGIERSGAHPHGVSWMKGTTRERGGMVRDGTVSQKDNGASWQNCSQRTGCCHCVQRASSGNGDDTVYQS